jgi:hypothetical protein
MNALDTPWKIVTGIEMYLCSPVARLLFSLAGIQRRPGWKFYGLPSLQKHRLSQMSFGEGLQLRSSRRSNPLSPNHPVVLCTWQAGARLKVGDHFHMTGGSLVAAELVSIGDRVIVGANSVIADTDFHPANMNQRLLTPNEGNTAPVHIENDVFIGTNCFVLKGVTIGCGSLIGAGSVVVKSIPSGVIAAGNPAKVIRSL